MSFWDPNFDKTKPLTAEEFDRFLEQARRYEPRTSPPASPWFAAALRRLEKGKP